MMINKIRKFKHMSKEKLTEVGFCPSIKNQVESFMQAGGVLAGAQASLFHFNDDNLDPDIEPESLYNDKIEQSERIQELSSKLDTVNEEKNFVEQSLKLQEKDLKKSSKENLNKKEITDNVQSEDKA